MQEQAGQPLRWNNGVEIAQALEKEYAGTDRLSLSLPDLEIMIRNLPYFMDNDPANDKVLQSILWTWMRLSHGDDGDYPTAVVRQGG